MEFAPETLPDALVLQQERSFSVNPGQLIQMWLTIFNPELTAGNYMGKIAVNATKNNGEKLQAEIIPITIEIQTFALPSSLALKTCNWSYYKVATESEMAEDTIMLKNLKYPSFIDATGTSK